MENKRTLSKLLKERGIANKEVTRFKGKYHLLHICQNNMPVPLIISEDPAEIKDFIELNY